MKIDRVYRNNERQSVGQPGPGILRAVVPAQFRIQRGLKIERTICVEKSDFIKMRSALSTRPVLSHTNPIRLPQTMGRGFRAISRRASGNGVFAEKFAE